MTILALVLEALAVASLLCVIVIGLGYLSLPLLFLAQRKNVTPIPSCPPDEKLPVVLVQLPIFNEPHMVTGLLRGAAALDWPRDRLQIQLLDDSFDDTTMIAAPVIEELRRQGFTIEHRHRTQRSGFKAGALAQGMAASDAPFIAILDADFRPPANWLRAVMGYFLADPHAGFVQSRFEFSNWNANLLTRAQALLSDAHFVMEQNVRARAGLLFQFNGTAGILRRAAIAAASGWSDDSLAEDLDLTVRMEMAGWHGVFVMQPPVGGLVPERMNDWRVQQRRWASGFAQVARKLLAAIAGSDWPAPKKLSAAFLILYQAAFPLVVTGLAAVLIEWAIGGTLPVLVRLLAAIVALLIVLVLLGMTLLPYLALRRGGLLAYAGTVASLPLLLIYLSFANTLPMVAAFFGRRESFKRTPKPANSGQK